METVSCVATEISLLSTPNANNTEEGSGDFCE